MRVLMVVHNYYPRDIRVRREAEAVAGAGHEVEVVCLRDTIEASRERVRGISVRRLPVSRHRESGLSTYLLEYALFAILAFFLVVWRTLKRRYDIIHVHNPPDFLLWTGLPARWLRGTRLVLDVHDLTSHLFSSRFGDEKPGWRDRIIEAQENACVRLADLVVTVHEDYRLILMEKGVAEDRIHVAMNCPDDRIFDPKLFTDRKPPADRFVLIYHGLLAERGGVDLLVKAVACLRDEIPELELRLCGWGPLEDTLVREADSLGLNGAVRFLGRLPWDEIPGVLLEAHLGCIPNRSDRINRYALNNKILECVAMGLPVVASGSEALARYFGEDQIAFIEPDDLESLIGAIRRLYRDREARTAMARAASRFHEEHRWSTQAVRLAERLERLGTESS